MENNSDRMGFALIALSVVAFVLLAVNGPLKSTVGRFFNGFKDWQTQTFDDISESNKPDVIHTAWANSKFLCKDWDSFTLSETSFLRFGIDTRWVYKELPAGTYKAGWELFGSDPASGVRKNVELVSDFSTVFPNLNLFTGTSDKPFTKMGGSWNNAVIGVYNTPKVGQEYTVSVEVPEADHNVILEVFRWNNAGARVGSVVANKVVKSGEKAHVTFTWTDPGNSGATQFAADLVWTNGTDTGTYSYCKAKLEIGNTATPYMRSASEVKPSDQPKYIGTYVDKNDSASQKPSDYTWKLNPDYHE